MMTDRNEVRRWMAAVKAQPYPLTWLVAADWFQEYGHDGLASDLRLAETADKASRLIRDEFFWWHPDISASGHSFRTWCHHLTPQLVADWATDVFPALGRGRVETVQGPVRPDQTGHWAAEQRAAFRRNGHIIYERIWGGWDDPDYRMVRRWVEYQSLKYSQPICRERQWLHIDISLHVGRVLAEDSPRRVMWPPHVVDARVTVEAPGGYERVQEPVAEYAELFGDLFVRPADTNADGRHGWAVPAPAVFG